MNPQTDPQSVYSTWWQKTPLFCVLLAVLGAFAFIPAMHALWHDDFRTSRNFFYSGLVLLLVAGLFVLALANRKAGVTSRAQLTTLVLTYVLFPLFATLPFALLVPDLSLSAAYFEMMSSLTTTGATVFEIDRLSESLHLWRAIVAWFGGFLILLAATAILQPLNLGGFEIQAELVGARPGEGRMQRGAVEASFRLVRTAQVIAPLYLTFTAVLAVILTLTGQDILHAFIHAMSIVSTSGITAHQDGFSAGQGRLPEIAAALFLVLAATHRGFMLRFNRSDLVWLRNDRELRMIGIAVLAVTVCLFVRHWIGAITVDLQDDSGSVIAALWGSIFTALSFLTTAGFESVDWERAQSWSGLGTSGIILLFLATFGGGIASTAGGVKLLRTYALFQQSVRELGRLSHPHSIGGSGEAERRIRREGASIAWVFLMLFLMTLSVGMLLLAATGVRFEHAASMAIAALSNTGPVYELAAPDGPGFDQLAWNARVTLCVLMVLGRLETLAVLAFLNFYSWR